MKKVIESWKIWTILSALLFLMTCGVFVAYATSSSGSWYFNNTYGTGTIGNKLDDVKWNSLMDDLDNLIPKGTIMAFAKDTCPTGWTPYTLADGRFLMWTNNGVEVEDIWWNNNIILLANQLPPHQHKIKYRNRSKFGDNANTRGVVVDWNTEDVPSGVNVGGDGRENNNTYSSQTAPVWKNRWTSQTWIDITNPYVKVLYCIKWTYSSPNRTVNILVNYGNRWQVDEDSVTSSIGTSITISKDSSRGYLKIGDKTVTATPHIPEINDLGTWTYYFSKWQNNCGSELRNNCTIIAIFGENYVEPRTCFVAWTKVTMADWTQKNIEDVKIWEKVLWSNWIINTVVWYDRPVLWDRHLWSINGSEYFVSDEHPFMTTEWWKSFNPEMTKLEIDLDTTELKVWDILITENGEEEIKSVDYIDADYNTPLYNLVLDWDHTYYANNYLVHNKAVTPMN